MLSDGEMIQRRNMQHTAFDSAPLSVYFLIANARLEFSLSHSKDSPLRIPNRERIAIFHPRSHIKIQKVAERATRVACRSLVQSRITAGEGPLNF